MWEGSIFAPHSILQRHGLVPAQYATERKNNPMLRYFETRNKNLWHIVRVQSIIPGHSLTIPSNYASQQELLLHGK
jgi:hypothetical protein